MKCRKCGAEYGEDVKFCTKCGASMEDEGQDSQAWTSAGTEPAKDAGTDEASGAGQDDAGTAAEGQTEAAVPASSCPAPDRRTQGQRQKDRLRRQLMERRRLIKQQGSRQ